MFYHVLRVQACVTVGLMILQYSFNFDFLETDLLLKKHWLAKYALFPSVILYWLSSSIALDNFLHKIFVVTNTAFQRHTAISLTPDPMYDSPC
jgi:hypothetical protein